MSLNGNALEVEHLTVRFGETVVLHDLSFSVATASTLAIIGPNGAGKSVLFRALIGAIPSEGRIRWAEGVKFGYVPQKLDIERDLPITGRDFLAARAAIVHASRAEIASALERVDLASTIVAAPIGALSGGQFQRLLVAAALIGNPDVLLLDEPSASIDEAGQWHLLDTIRRLRADRGITELVISHDLSVVSRYADNVLCLGGGHVCFGPPQTTLTAATLAEIYGSPVALHVHHDAND